MKYEVLLQQDQENTLYIKAAQPRSNTQQIKYSTQARETTTTEITEKNRDLNISDLLQQPTIRKLRNKKEYCQHRDLQQTDN